MDEIKFKNGSTWNFSPSGPYEGKEEQMVSEDDLSKMLAAYHRIPPEGHERMKAGERWRVHVPIAVGSTPDLEVDPLAMVKGYYEFSLELMDGEMVALLCDGLILDKWPLSAPHEVTSPAAPSSGKA